MPASKDAANALELTLKLIDEWKEQGLKPSEFEFSKEAIVNKMAFIGNTPAERIENKISEIVRDLPEGFYDHLIDKVSEVSFSEANQALSNEIKPETFIIVVLCTANELKASLAKAAGVPESEVIVIPYDED